MNPGYSEAIKALRFFVRKYTFKNKFRIIVKKCTLGNFRSFFYLFFFEMCTLMTQHGLRSQFFFVGKK